MSVSSLLVPFHRAAAALDAGVLRKKQLDVEVGEWLNSVVLRMQKKHWCNNPDEKPHIGPAIFFSVWITPDGVKKNTIFYNIHALKLRELNGHRITSRAFAAAFRQVFKVFEQSWPNVSVAFGPLTLMQGWVEIDPASCEDEIRVLAEKFLKIDSLIDGLLEQHKA